MKDFLSLLIEFKDLLFPVLIFLARSLIAVSIGLAIVYIFGRLLGLILSYRWKNTVALITIIAVVILQELFVYEHSNNTPDIIMSIVLYCAISIICYTIFGMKLFNRISSYLDSKIAPDNSTEETNFTQKSKPKKKKKVTKKSDSKTGIKTKKSKSKSGSIKV